MDRLEDIFKESSAAWQRQIKSSMRFKTTILGSAFLVLFFSVASPVAEMVKNLPAMWEIQILSLGWEDPLDKEMATHSSILAWRIPWTEEPGRLLSMGLERVGYDWATIADFLHL